MIIVYLKINLNRPLIFEKLPFAKIEPKSDKSKIESESGSKINLIIYEPVSSKKTEKELKTVADLALPDKVRSPIKIGNKISAKENKSDTTELNSSKKDFTKTKIKVASKKEKIILTEVFKSPNLYSQKFLKITNIIVIIRREIKKRKLFLIFSENWFFIKEITEL